MTLVNLEDGCRQTMQFEHGNPEQIINTSRFVDDKAGGLKVIVGGNTYQVEIYDFDHSTRPAASVGVDYFVNHISVNKLQSMMALAYDHTCVEIFDLRSMTKVISL